MRRATVYDVAERAGVSTATVSFAFRRPEKVKPATREKVLEAARQLAYVPSASARGLARGRTGALGLYSFDMILESPQGADAQNAVEKLVMQEKPFGEKGESMDDLIVSSSPDVLTYPLYVDEVQRGFELECWHRGRMLLLGTAAKHDDEARITDIAGRVDGLAVFPNKYTDALPWKALCKSVPIVRISERDMGNPAAYLSCDDASGMKLLVDHLIDVHGIHDMRFIGGLTNYDVRQRFETLRAHLAERGFESPRVPFIEADEIDGSFLGALRVLVEEGLPGALVCGNDQMAYSVINALSDLGVRVPDDVAVTGFDGVIAGQVLSPRLTTVRQPMEEMGRLAACLLDEREGVPWDRPVEYVLPVALVVRESCGCEPTR
ncbi:LacI family DNA-binding transcriptional regulator [Bifidobacterium tsurumiense]|uniref:LacI family DNA-binding transcriptional regulator n=1 Tax=Bifidobacterium tsurumiense TaxID=356829 RepID=UPI0012B223EE|nr:LacI family DNA-binding transcriptional regulator [Bifidobacterium tsurumiense]MSS13307.1 LacI family transcriptional regulator [Bifidobacterium tsurumiense]